MYIPLLDFDLPVEVLQDLSRPHFFPREDYGSCWVIKLAQDGSLCLTKKGELAAIDDERGALVVFEDEADLPLSRPEIMEALHKAADAVLQTRLQRVQRLRRVVKTLRAAAAANGQ